jgi:hypothetical protein
MSTVTLSAIGSKLTELTGTPAALSDAMSREICD